ncbi:NTP transferase domain-containing protein [Leifsonia sp. NPDC077715]|uniref:molybdenum cofactor guanylyltransferase n=1 Tax=Leifsonia sp. NPDC077715 TaxID=3155539 RepID=UPI0034322C08
MGRATAVIVVAGGRSSRFGTDKLQHCIGGRTLLERTVDAARACAPVVLVGAVDAPPGVTVAVSEWPRWGGPCAAIAAGVDAVPCLHGDVLIVSADLADPGAAVSALLGIDGGVLMDPDGRPQWLLARAPLGALRGRVSALRADRPTLTGASAAALVGVIESRHTVDARVCADIDTPSDLPQAADPSKELLHGTV